jgi:hypothetical protein
MYTGNCNKDKGDHESISTGRMCLHKKRNFACEGLSHSRIMAFTATRSYVTEPMSSGL